MRAGNEAREAGMAPRDEALAEPHKKRRNDGIADIDVRAFGMPQKSKVGDDAAHDGPMKDPDDWVPHPDPAGDRVRGGRGDDKGGNRGHDQSTLFWITAPVTGLK